jgi:very-short-patch-repair endonuclease
MSDDELFREKLSNQYARAEFWAVERFQYLSSLCESPIEEMFLASMLAELMATESGSGFSARLSKFAIQPQERVGPYRLDFAIGYNPAEPMDVLADPTSIRIAVECDGHAFHEKTKEQAARDKARARAITLEGWTVLRFTGSEIYADADECARAVMDQITAEFKSRVDGGFQWGR